MNGKPTPWQRCLALCAAAIIISVLLAQWLQQPETRMPLAAQPAPQFPLAATSPDLPPAAAALQGIDATGAAGDGADSSTDSLDEYVRDKYRSLFGSGSFLDTQATGVLRRELIARERIAVAVNTLRQSGTESAQTELSGQEQALAAADAAIRSLLHPTDYAAFEVLKDSDIEQFQLDDFAGGISNIAPLSASDREALLRIKLLYKQRFRQVLLDSGLLRGDLSPQARHHAFAAVQQALDEYRRNYLQDARQYLYDDEQYTLLHNYETGEFTAELAKLSSIANGG